MHRGDKESALKTTFCFHFLIDGFGRFVVAHAIEHHGDRGQQAAPASNRLTGMAEGCFLPLFVILIQVFCIEHLPSS